MGFFVETNFAFMHDRQQKPSCLESGMATCLSSTVNGTIELPQRSHVGTGVSISSLSLHIKYSTARPAQHITYLRGKPTRLIAMKQHTTNTTTMTNPIAPAV